MNQNIIAAFSEIREGRSPDAVIAEKETNLVFLDACRAKGVDGTDEEINRSLQNARKASYLKGLKSKRVIVRDQSEYRFASEMAIRFLERRDSTTLDRVLCDPKKAIEFDELAERIAPGHTSFEYRWAALGLRKTRKLKPELVSRVVQDVQIARFRVDELDLESVPGQQGVYIFHDSITALYVGEAAHLYRRIKKHLDHSDNKGLAQWLWKHGAGDLHLEIRILPMGALTMVRKALEAELIKSRGPIFNVLGAET